MAGRYTLGERLGVGGTSVVFEGLEAASGRRVAIKVVSLESARDWKALELFERGTKILQGLRHAELPQIAAFERDERGRLYQVREIFDGGSLDSRVRAGQRFGRREAHRLLKALLELLDYLHRQTPPVLHRDIKPANIMFRTAADDSPVLVDFDAAALNENRGTSTTIIVSGGYTAPEQFLGQAQAASDLYSVGMTLLFVLSHSDPSELQQQNGRYVVSHLLSSLEPATAQVLKRLIDPDLMRRYSSAATALRDLRGLEPYKAASVAKAPFWNRKLEIGGVSVFRIVVGVALGLMLFYLLLIRWAQARQDELNSQRGLTQQPPP